MTKKQIPLPVFFKCFLLTVFATMVVELCWYPGGLFAVSADDVEVRQQVERDLNEELEAEQRQDAEVNTGQPRHEGLVGEFLCWVRHPPPDTWQRGLQLWWRPDQKALQEEAQEWSAVPPRGLTGRPIQAGRNALQLLLCLRANTAMLMYCVCVCVCVRGGGVTPSGHSWK